MILDHRLILRRMRMAILGVVVVVSGCARVENFQDLQAFVDEVKARPGSQVEPVPVFSAYEAFTYSAASYRSPFDVPIVVQPRDGTAAARDVQPDLERIREPLESQALGELSMVGMLQTNGVYVALIRDNLERVHRVVAGNYLGRNHGRVTSISATQLELIEIVPSGDGGWVERPQTLTLTQQ